VKKILKTLFISKGSHELFYLKKISKII